MKKNIILVFAVLLVVNIFSASYIEYYGSYNWVFTGREIGISGAPIFGSSAQAVLKNPGTIALKNGWTISVNGRVDRFAEDKSFPAYSFFDNLVGYQTYVSNVNFFGKYSIFISKGFQTGVFKFGVGHSYLPVVDYNYKYYEEIRDGENPEPNKLVINQYQTKNLLNSYNLSIGINVAENLLFGYTIGFLDGNYDYLKKVTLTPYGEGALTGHNPTSKESQSLKITGLLNVFNLGFNFKRFGWTLTYRLMSTKGKNYEKEEYFYDVTNNFIITSSEKDNPKFSYPSSLVVGTIYRPRSGIFSTLSANYIRTFWSKFDNDLETTDFYDTNDFNVGVEHLFDSGAIFRFGIFYHENYEIEHLAVAGITIGTGYNVSKKYFIDCGIEYSPLTYEMIDLFPDGNYNGLITGAVDRTSYDKIEQVRLRAIVSFGINLK